MCAADRNGWWHHRGSIQGRGSCHEGVWEPCLTAVLHTSGKGAAYRVGALVCSDYVYPQHTRILLCAFLMKNISYLNEAVWMRIL